MNPIHAWGIDLIARLQAAAPWLHGPMAFFSFLGTEEFFLLLLPFVYWCVDVSLGARIGFILCLSTNVNDFFKSAFHAPRPYWIGSGVDPLGSEPSYGLPSGHAQNATAIWGVLGAATRGVVRWAAIALILLVGISRVFLAVHFPTDVLFGWAIGGLVLWAFLRWERPALVWIKRQGLGQQIGLAFVASVILLAIPFAGRLFLPALDPSDWATAAARAFPNDLPINPRDTTGAVGVAGVFFGLAGGLMLLFAQTGYDARGLWWKRSLRFVVGVAGVMVFWLGLRLVFPRDDGLVAQVLRYMRYGLTGFWVTYCAPWLFIKLGLAAGTRTAPPADTPQLSLGIR